MYSYFLSDYIYTVTDKDKIKLKDLTKGKIVQLIVLIFFQQSCFCNNNIISINEDNVFLYFELIAIACLYIVVGCIIFINNKECKRNNIDYLKEYQNNFINDYIKRLKLLNMYSEKDILWLIDQKKVLSKWK